MGLQPRRRPPAVEPTVTPEVSETASATPETEEAPEREMPNPRCRTYDGSGAFRCVKPLGHVGDGDPDHEFEGADE